MRLLIVSEEASAARALAILVETCGHHVVGIVGSDGAALAVAEQQHADLVLLDARRGDYAAPYQRDARLRIPVIALMAHAAVEEVRWVADTAPSGYLLKPVDANTLWSLLELVIDKPQWHAASTSSGSNTAAILLTNIAGRITFINTVAAQLLGLAPNTLIGRSLNAVLACVDAATRQPLPDLVTHVLMVGAPLNQEAPALLLAHNGQEWRIDTRTTPITDHNGQIISIMVSIRGENAHYATECTRRQTEAALRETNARLAASLMELERRTSELIVLNELGGAMMACSTLDEGYATIAGAAQRLFPEADGALFVQRHPLPMLDPAITWGLTHHPYPSIHAQDCQALRAGQLALCEEACGSCHCEQIAPMLSRYTLCLPLSAEGHVHGVLHVHLVAAEPAGISTASYRLLAMTFAKQAALGLANIHLRIALSEQAIRDPLTGLFNRRYLEETLVRELHRAARDHYPVGVIMLDVDHFKRINDTFGHDAGDTLLRALSTQLLTLVRAGDVVCRYGGEEFVLMLPAATLDVVTARAEAIRQTISKLAVTHHEHTLPTVTVSLGVTVVADIKADLTAALARADAALYAAKRAGRDRVVTLH